MVGIRQKRRRTPCLMAINPADPDSRLFTLTKSECSIGSDESNDLVIRDNTVSRRHATIRRRRRRWELIDLGSTNGTFVDNSRISGSAFLRDGQDVRFGGARLVFRRTAPSQPKGARTLARPLRRRFFRLRTAIELIIVAFVFGFAGTQYFSYINYRHLADTQRARSKPVASPTLQTARKTTPAAHASPAPLGTESS
jgi:FHA domain-containing protein